MRVRERKETETVLREGARVTQVTLTSDITVNHIQSVGDDLTICRAAWQSSTDIPPEEATEARLFGLLRSLIRHRHGSPLEAGFLTVAVHAPLFVLAQWVRHRHTSISIDDLSYSVESGRYRELAPVFWVPRPDRPILKASPWNPMRPQFERLDSGDRAALDWMLEECYGRIWEAYRRMLAMGIAPEVARSVLPQSTYCHWWASGNLRSWLSFLSLRTKDAGADVVSHVQMETEETGRAVERLLGERWPLVMRAWRECGRGAV